MHEVPAYDYLNFVYYRYGDMKRVAPIPLRNDPFTKVSLRQFFHFVVYLKEQGTDPPQQVFQ